MDIANCHFWFVFWACDVCTRWKPKVGAMDNGFWWTGERAFNATFVFGWLTGYVRRVCRADKTNSYHSPVGRGMDDMDVLYARIAIYR